MADPTGWSIWSRCQALIVPLYHQKYIHIRKPYRRWRSLWLLIHRNVCRRREGWTLRPSTSWWMPQPARYVLTDIWSRCHRRSTTIRTLPTAMWSEAISEESSLGLQVQMEPCMWICGCSLLGISCFLVFCGVGIHGENTLPEIWLVGILHRHHAEFFLNIGLKLLLVRLVVVRCMPVV